MSRSPGRYASVNNVGGNSHRAAADFVMNNADDDGEFADDTEREQSMSDIPNPGSDQAILLGCRCPVLDNGYGRGLWGGEKDARGEVVFVIASDCPLHGSGESKA